MTLRRPVSLKSLVLCLLSACFLSAQQQPAPPKPAAEKPQPQNPFESVPQAAEQPKPQAPKPPSPFERPAEAPKPEEPKPAAPGEPAKVADEIEAIEFRGARRVPQDTLRALIFSKSGDRIDADTLHRDFMALWNTGRFDDITLELSLIHI